MIRGRVVRLIKNVYENIGTGVVIGSLMYSRGHKNRQYPPKKSTHRFALSLSITVCSNLPILYRCYVSHVEETPITGRKQFLIFSRKKAEKESQEKFEKLMKQYTGSIVPLEHPQSLRVMKLANRLLDANKDIPEIHTKNWTFTVVKDPSTSAFSLFNGHIFISTVEETTNSDGELAITLGHEIAHSLLGHHRERSSNLRVLLCVALLIYLIVLAILPFNLITLIAHIVGYQYVNDVFKFVLNYLHSRKQENEADAVGLQLAAKACFDVRAAVAHYHKLAAIDELFHGGLNRSREWRSSHPSHATRQKELEKQLPSSIRIREQCDCPELPFIDPRYVLRKTIEEIVAEKKQK